MSFLFEATVADAARAADVSSMTASRVVNNKGVTSPATRERVAAVGHRPNRLTRARTQRKTQTLGPVVPDIANAFFADTVRGAEDAAWKRGYTLLLCRSRLPDARLAELVAAQPATLLVNRVLLGSGALTLQTDAAEGARRAVTHLLNRGPRRIGLLAGPEGSQSGRLRLRGYRQALEGAGLGFEERYVRPCAPDEQGGYKAGLALLQAQPGLAALFCYNDPHSRTHRALERTLNGFKPRGDAMLSRPAFVPAQQRTHP